MVAVNFQHGLPQFLELLKLCDVVGRPHVFGIIVVVISTQLNVSVNESFEFSLNFVSTHICSPEDLGVRRFLGDALTHMACA